MRSFLVALAGLILFAGHAAQAKVDILVDKNNQIMTVSVDGVAKYHWPVSTGIPSRETPDGTFRAFRMEESHFSKEFDDAPMPHSIFFTKIGHAIHGTDSEGRLGTPASHGCVRLSKANASTLYALVEEQGVLNTTVTLTGSAAVALARHPNNAVASRAPAPAPVQSPDDQDQYASATGGPIVLTPQARLYPGRQAQPQAQTYGSNQQAYSNNSGYAQQRPDDGYIYPADGSSDRQIYPAPRGSRYYDAQAYQQQPRQYYDTRGYVPPPPGYYNQQPQQYYQPRGYYQ
ncbi:MAG: L,D-transpeptidase family protein [Bradyrhizobium sp.]|nr:L,D-transpeptidase family protein [Bradyrhizobium sp.]